MLVKFIIFFLLAHLIGDFVLQGDTLAYKKIKDKRYLIKHIIIITVVQLIIMSLFGIKGIIAAFTSGILHYIFDYIKPIYSKKYYSKTILFLVDQALHILVILILSMLLNSRLLFFNEYIYIINYLISYILSAYVITIIIKFVLYDIIKEYSLVPFFKKRERLIDGLLSIIVLSIIYCINNLFILLFSIIAFYMIFYKYEKDKYNYTNIIISIKLLIILILNVIIRLSILP